jgi:hypothetical protein
MQRLEKKEPDAGGLLGAFCMGPEETSKNKIPKQRPSLIGARGKSRTETGESHRSNNKKK